MKEKNLLASVALFGELYNSEKYTGVASILAEYIKAAVVYNKKFDLSSFEITKLLKKVNEFIIPESVIRTILITNLKSVVEVKKNIFHFNKSITSEFIDFDREIEEKNNIQNKIFSDLINYVSEKGKKELNDSDKNELFSNFINFLFGNGDFEKYSNYISAFIIQNEGNSDFVQSLNLIREGLILYQGIRYTADVNELGKWDTDLVLYLNTECLFNALGYNGILFKEIFDDFYKLVTEINSSSIKQNQGEKIKLRYFSETRDEIDSFFVSAENIKKGYRRLESWKTAMKIIVDSCTTPSDVVAKRVNFYSELEAKGITLQEFEYDVCEYLPFNVEDESSLEKLKEIAKEKNKDFDYDSCRQFLWMFTKINFFRKGNSKKPFEKIGHIFVTESGFAKYLGHNNIVKFDEYDTSFAKDIDFVTTRFWFKLKKGFSEKHTLPKSFDVLTKARIVLSSHIHSSLSKEFQKLVKDTEEGKLTKEEALSRSYALREKPNKPEDITIEKINSALDFLNNDEYFEEESREKERKDELLRELQKKNEELQAEINRRDEIERKIEKEKKEKEFNNRKTNYVSTQWKIVRKKKIKELCFLVLVVFLVFFTIFLGIMLKANKDLDSWMKGLGKYQYLVWIGYALLVAIELIGRAYFIQKERVVNGWLFFCSLFKYKKLKSKYKDKFEKDFVDKNPNGQDYPAPTTCTFPDNQPDSKQR